MRKRIVSFFLAIFMLLGMTACSDSQKKQKVDTNIEVKDFWNMVDGVRVHLQLITNDTIKPAATPTKDEAWKKYPSTPDIHLYTTKYPWLVAITGWEYTMRFTFLTEEEMQQILDSPQGNGYYSLKDITDKRKHELYSYDIDNLLQCVDAIWEGISMPTREKVGRNWIYIVHLKDADIYLRCATVTREKEVAMKALEAIYNFEVQPR